MAGDISDLDAVSKGESQQAQAVDESPRSRRRKPKHDFPQTQAGKLWDAFGSPEEPINTMPGGTYNTAGGRPAEYTWKDAFKFTDADFQRFYKTGCARDSLLVGMGGAAAIGGLTVIIGGMPTLFRAANFSVGTFCVATTGMYTWCEQRRRREAAGMAQAVAGMKRLQEKKKLEEKEAREKAAAAAKQAEEERKKQSWTRLSNYKFW